MEFKYTLRSPDELNLNKPINTVAYKAARNKSFDTKEQLVCRYQEHM